MNYAIKILIVILFPILMALPLIPSLNTKRRNWLADKLRYEAPENRKNLIFIPVAFLFIVALVVLSDLLHQLVDRILSIPFVGNLFAGIFQLFSPSFSYKAFTVSVVVINLMVVYGFVLLKSLIKFGSWLKNRKKKKDDGKDKEKKEPEEESTPEKTVDPEDELSTDGTGGKKITPNLDLTEMLGMDEDDPAPIITEPKLRVSLFFYGDNLEYVKPWAIRFGTILQYFVFISEFVYIILFTLMTAAALFTLPDFLYKFLMDILQMDKWYMYPFPAILLLQEFRNYLAGIIDNSTFVEEEKARETQEQQMLQIDLAKLRAELYADFDEDHHLRSFPAAELPDVPEYQSTNPSYSTAIEYIRRRMQKKANKVVQDYLKSIDALFNDYNVYFGIPFYCELGEYLVNYSYIRLLSGARLVFVVQDAKDKDQLRAFISSRLREMTGTFSGHSWRIYTSDERLDQADILIASPNDFRDDNIVEHYPGFFEEVCTAFFIDADKIIAQESYLCPVMASRLQKASNKNIRFAFLSQFVLEGFASRTLPKFFCVDKVLHFSGATEKEKVDYYLWNRESRNERVYNKHGHKLASLEGLIAERAYEYHRIDGVRVISTTPIEHGDMEVLKKHNVEINDLFKEIPRVNYMIFSDERCNLAAALYACTRFRGREASVAHIISRPYLLRDYFMARAVNDDYINRSPFLRPRVTEHVDQDRLSYLRFYCETTIGDGLSEKEFSEKIRKIIRYSLKKRDGIPNIAACRYIIKDRVQWLIRRKGYSFAQDDYNYVDEFSVEELAKYLICALCDPADQETVTDWSPADETENAFTKEEMRLSVYQESKNFYVITSTGKGDGYHLEERRFIRFVRVSEVFDKVFACNRHVDLKVNDEILGTLYDTSPARLKSEYVAGQNFIFNNAEYEIDKISTDGTTIFLRQENDSFRYRLDTVFLKRFDLTGAANLRLSDQSVGVVNDSRATLRNIRIAYLQADCGNASAGTALPLSEAQDETVPLIGETYGYYSLSANRPTLDFYRGMEGNPYLTPAAVKENARRLRKPMILAVELSSTIACNDGMRLLLSVVFNEFLKTIFPDAYRCISVCPILEKPLEFNETNTAREPLDRIRSLYPYLKNLTNDTASDAVPEEEKTSAAEADGETTEYPEIYDADAPEDDGDQYPLVENRKNRLRFLFINDCAEDVGVLDRFFDASARTMQELLINVNSYLQWVSRHPERKHYIYFGAEQLPECFDIAGCCRLLKDFTLSMSDQGQRNYGTADDGEAENEELRCSFCHLKMESGRYVPFGKNRFICSDCMAQAITEEGPLPDLQQEIRKYLHDRYPGVTIGNISAKLEPMSEPEPGHFFSEDYYRFDYDTATALIETGDPVANDKVAMLRSLISEWQSENNLIINYAPAQLYYEELLYLQSRVRGQYGNGSQTAGRKEYKVNQETVFWIYDNLPDNLRSEIEEIAEYTGVPIFSDAERPQAPDKSEPETPDETKDIGTDPDPRGEALEETLENTTEGSEESSEEDSEEDSEESSEEDSGEDSGEKDQSGDNPAPTAPRTSFDFMFEAAKKLDELDRDSEIDRDEECADKLYNPRKTPRFWKRYLKGERGSDQEDKLTEDMTTENDSSSSEEESDEPERGSVGLTWRRKYAKYGVTKEDFFSSNPSIRLYTQLVIHAYSYSEEQIPFAPLSISEASKVYRYVISDYPELFWIQGYSYTSSSIGLLFRCKDLNGNLDLRQIREKSRQIEKGAKTFTKGISRRTDPYEAFLKIYRRMVLTLDYDGVGLMNRIDGDTTRDDQLRSLYGAFVEHKVVCAGYAVALQYLMQKIGITSGYVVSEIINNSCHAFNIVKFGRNCYYVDVTWADSSNTKTGTKNSDLISYSYCCVPLREFRLTGLNPVQYHTPNRTEFPDLEELNYSSHEFYRYHNAFLKRYNTQDLARILADEAKNHDRKTMGRFVISFRCASTTLAESIFSTLLSGNTFFDILAKSREMVKDKKRAALLTGKSFSGYVDSTGVVYIELKQ